MIKTYLKKYNTCMYTQPTSDTWAARKIPAWKRKCRTRAISNLKWDGANSLPREFAEPNWTWILQRLKMIILNSQSDYFRVSWTCFTLFLFFCNQIKLVSPSKRMIWPQEFQCGKMSNVETTHGLSNEHTIGFNLWNKSLSLTQMGPFTEPTD